MASFIGYAPAAHPKLAAIVVLDEPANTYGGTAAAPVFADVMQFALTHDAVAPDDPANSAVQRGARVGRGVGYHLHRPGGGGGRGRHCRPCRGGRPRRGGARRRGRTHHGPGRGHRPDRCDRSHRRDAGRRARAV